MSQVLVPDLQTAPPISLQELRRPLRAHEQRLFHGVGEGRDLVSALQSLLEQDDDEAVAMAEAVVFLLIGDEMERRFFDVRSGDLRRFTDQLEKAVDSFEASIR